MKVIKLNEMASSRADAINTCIDLGEKFVEHFKKIVADSDVDTKYHHAAEMQAWFNKASSIKLKINNKPLATHHLYDWFITLGKLPVDLFGDDDIAELYVEFADNLLDTYDVTSSLVEIGLLEEK